MLLLILESQAQLHFQFSLPPPYQKCKWRASGACGQFITHYVCYSFQEPTVSPWHHRLLWAALLQHGASPWATGAELPHHGLQGNLCSGIWSTSSPCFSTDLSVCRTVALTCSLSPLWLKLHNNFPPSIFLVPRHYCHHRWPQPWPAGGPSWSWLALALLDTGDVSSSFLQKVSSVAPLLSKSCHVTKYILLGVDSQA